MGVLGLTDPATGSLLPQRLYGDLRFSHPDNEEQSLARSGSGTAPSWSRTATSPW